MAAERNMDGRLFDLYRRYIGEPDGRTDVYVGFGLFLAGIALAISALALFLWSTNFERGGEYFALTGPAYAMGMLSVPALMLGITVLLPASRKVLVVSVLGAGLAAAATGLFVQVYPEYWNFMQEIDYTAEVTALYATGLAGISASTGAALIAHYLDMARTVEAIDREGATDEDVDDDPSISDDVIQQDIEDAMEGVELSWGGVEKDDNTHLQFTDHEFDEVNVDVEATTTRSSGVDSQVAGLKGLKGGDTKTKTSTATVDDQTQKLKELQQQRDAEALATAPDDDTLSQFNGTLSALFDRVRSLLSRK